MDTLGNPLKFICSLSSMLQGEMGPDGAKGERGEPGMTVSGDPMAPPHSDARFPCFAFHSVLRLYFKFRRTKSDSTSAQR